MFLIHCCIVSSLLFVVACTDAMEAPATTSQSGSESGNTETFDEQVVLASIPDYADELIRINREPRPSRHALADTVNVWVAPEAADLYRSVNPDTEGITADPFQAGTMLVKEHLSMDGSVVGLTVMVKADSGFDPDVADWWWARTNAAGVAVEKGNIGYCVDCHTPASSTDWVFGVPLDNRP